MLFSSTLLLHIIFFLNPYFVLAFLIFKWLNFGIASSSLNFVHFFSLNLQCLSVQLSPQIKLWLFGRSKSLKTIAINELMIKLTVAISLLKVLH